MELSSLAGALERALTTAVPIEPLSEQRPGLTVAEAYEVQRMVVARRRAAGARTVGWKIGLTSRAMQEQLGVGEPDYAAVLSDMVVASGGEVPLGALIAPRVEAEIAFELVADLEGPGVTEEQVWSSTGRVMPALEIIDSRVKDWRITLPDTVADLASCGRIVVGTPQAQPAGAEELRDLRTTLSRNGSVVAEGVGANSLGDPLTAVAWLANALHEHGDKLERGAVVMSGALHAAVPAEPGNDFLLRCDVLGQASVRFVD